MTVARATTSTELLAETIDVLKRRHVREQADPSLVLHVGSGEDLTFSADLATIGTVRVTTLPVYHDVLRGGRLRYWIGRRWFVERERVA